MTPKRKRANMTGPPRKSYTAKHKLEVIAYAKEHGNRAAGRQYGVAETCVRHWKKMEEELKMSQPWKRARRGQSAKLPILEDHLVSWVRVQRDACKASSIVNIPKHKRDDTTGPPRKSYTAKHKLEVIAYAKKHGNRAAGRQYGVAETCVREWKKAEEELKMSQPWKRAGRGRNARWPILEDNLASWVRAQRGAGRVLSAVNIHTKAQTMAVELGIMDFKGSPSWVFKFMKRKRLSVQVRKTVGTHFGLKPFKRKFCHKSFSSQSYLNTHVRTHTERKPYKCEKCHKAFTQMVQLRNHSKTHREKRFQQTEDLTGTAKTDMKEKPKLKGLGIQMSPVDSSGVFLVKPFGCVICDDMFKVEKEFIYHCFQACYSPVDS